MTRQNLAAVLASPKAPLKTTMRPIPTPGPSELVIRNHAIAANPVDWKMQDYGFAISSYPTVLGSDVCGVVTAVGSNATKFKHGDRVTGFAGVIGTGNPEHGAWQQYSVVRDIAACKIPESMGFEQGAVFPMAMATCAVAFFERLGIQRPGRVREGKGKGEALLVWGAASSVGQSAVQLARELGFRVFATASEKHHESLRKLGAEVVVDYHDADAVEKIVEAAKKLGTPIKLGFDTVAEGTTSKTSSDILLQSGGKGGKLCLVLPWNEEYPKPEGVELSEPVAFKAFMDYQELGAWFFNEYLEKALEDGSIVPAPEVEVIEGGVEQAQSTLDRLKKGVSGKKLVVTVDCDHQ